MHLLDPTIMLIIMTLLAASMFLIWLGDRITEMELETACPF